MTILVGTTASRFPENFKQKVGREAKALNYKQLLHSSPRGGPEGGKSPSVSLQSKHPVRLQTAPAFFPQGFQREGAQSTLGDLSGGTARAASSFPSPCAPPAQIVPWKEGKNQSCAGFMHPAFPALRTRGGGAASVPAGTGIYKKLCKADPSKKIRFRVGFQTRPLQGGQDPLPTPGSHWSLVLQRDRHRAPRIHSYLG